MILWLASCSANAENWGQRVWPRVHAWKIRRNQSTTGPAAFIYLPVSRDDAQWKVRRRAPGRPRSLATVADDSSSGLARSVTRVQLGASQRSWHGAFFRLGETRFEEGRGNGRGSGVVIRRLNFKYLERYVHLPYGARATTGKIHFRSYGNGISRHESVEQFLQPVYFIRTEICPMP